MNLEDFKEVYLKTISESADDSDLKNWIRSIVEEYSIEDLTRKIKILDAMIAPSSGATDGERENAIKLKQNLQKKLQDLQQTTPDSAYEYARDILKGPFPKGEDTINKNPYYKKLYQEFLNKTSKQQLPKKTIRITRKKKE
jgi:hypothetical protein